MQTLIYYYPRNVLLPSILAGIFMVLLCFFLIYIGVFVGMQDYVLGEATPIASLFLGIVGIGFFGYLLIHLIYRVFSKKPILEVREEGIIDNSSLFATNITIPYENIRKIAIELSLGKRVIAINVHQEDDILSSISFIKKIAMKIRKIFVKDSFLSIEVHGQNRTEYEKIVKSINQNRRKLGLIP